MKVVIPKRQRGPNGPAQIRVSAKKTVIVFDESGDTFEFPADEVPATVKTGKWYASVSADGTKFWGARPISGTYMTKFDRISAPPSDRPGFPSIPAPRRDQRTGRRQDGTTYPIDQLVFTAILKVTEGTAEDMEIPVPLVYNFTDDGEGNVAVKGSGKKSQQLADLLTASGVWDVTLRYSENILPALETAVKNADRTFMTVMKDGWPQSFAPAPEPVTKKRR